MPLNRNEISRRYQERRRATGGTVISVQLDADMKDRLTAESDRTGTPKAQIIRNLLNKVLPGSPWK